MQYLLDSVLWAKLAYCLPFEAASRRSLQRWEKACEDLLKQHLQLGHRMSPLALHASATLGGVGVDAFEDPAQADRVDRLFAFSSRRR